MCAAGISAPSRATSAHSWMASPFRPATTPRCSGSTPRRRASSTRLTLLSVGAVAAIFLILLADFGSGLVATLVFLTLPFALVGAGHRHLPDRRRSLTSIAGRPGHGDWDLRSEWHHACKPLSASRVRRRRGQFGRDLIVRGSEERLAPILMTALATGLALVPIVLGGGSRGLRDRASARGRHPLEGSSPRRCSTCSWVPALYLRYGRPAATTTEDAV